jgi:hypothetical protein
MRSESVRCHSRISATVKLTQCRTFSWGVVRIAGSATDQVRVGHQSQDREGHWIDIALALRYRADEVIE